MVAHWGRAGCVLALLGACGDGRRPPSQPVGVEAKDAAQVCRLAAQHLGECRASARLDCSDDAVRERVAPCLWKRWAGTDCEQRPLARDLKACFVGAGVAR